MTTNASKRVPSSRFRTIARMIIGYVIAVAGGAIVFSLLNFLSPYSPDKWMFEQEGGNDLQTIAATSAICFELGLVFGLPYTALVALAMRYAPPISPRVFLVIGMLCPAAAMLTLMVISGSSREMSYLLPYVVISLPAGLFAAYLFGAIGFGLGFRRWRFA